MKNTILTVASLLSLLIAPAPAFALVMVPHGGTGWASFESGALIYGNGASSLATTTPGTLGYVLQFNGTFPTWVSTSSLGVVAHPGGSDRQVQFNDGGSLGGDGKLVFDKTGTGQLTVGGVDTSGFLPDPGTHIGLALNSGKWIQFNDDPTNHFARIGVQDATTPGQGTDVSLVAGNSNGTSTAGGIAEMDGAFGKDANDNNTGPAIMFVEGGHADGSGGNIFLEPGFSGNTPGKVNIIANPGGVFLKFDVSLISSSDKTVKFPNVSGTFGLLEANQTWSGNNTFSKGTGATTTVTFGTPGDSTSHVCFNTKNTDGQDISFYFVGTSMVVANIVCQ